MYFMCHVCVDSYNLHHLFFINSSIFSLEVTMLTAMVSCIDRNRCTQHVGECCCNVVYGVLYTSCVLTCVNILTKPSENILYRLSCVSHIHADHEC